MQIGNLKLTSNLLLAPLAGYCDVGFRLAVRALGGLGLACTELISCRRLLSNTLDRVVRVCADDQPLCVQLHGTDVAMMADAARRAVELGAAMVDINMGCPVSKVIRQKSGAAMLSDLPLAVRLVEAVVGAVSVPITVKARLGPDQDNVVAPRLAQMIADAGAAAMAIHGRTTAQRFGGVVSLEHIGEVVAAAGDMPVIGNGDVRTPEDAALMIERTGCAGVMIGRGALRDPWIFRDTDAFLRVGCVPPPPSIAERVALMVRHFDHLAALQGERRACHIIRHRVSWYAKKLGPCRRFKVRVSAVQTLAEFHRYVDEFLAEAGARDVASREAST